ncbi:MULTISPECIES: single-stranded DNA-binding protein [Parafilimonas]|jgi:single-strand DNA-binding protein|uniref:Single-stranded DNA-binding protein n=1 Tax=Parafilimonas terrae TaxID=1465490 RepID=A0A1I5XD98_9BACT|nr:single-stranded DNA-binding protein [Parafilimonas terrae]SFQ29617.1 single-strand binding protein [Parafilimonas terrae]
MIKLMVIGNLGKDCIVNTVNGKNVINFNVAHTEKFKDSTGAQREKTTWVECAYWTDRTGIAPYLKKGTQVYAEGTPEVRTYQTNDGKSGASLSLRVQSVQLLGSRADGLNAGGQPQERSYQTSNGSSYANNTAQGSNDDMSNAGDDLPF